MQPLRRDLVGWLAGWHLVAKQPDSQTCHQMPPRTGQTPLMAASGRELQPIGRAETRNGAAIVGKLTVGIAAKVQAASA